MLWLQLICFVGAGLGTVVFLLALRGRQVDEHPLCAECDFDLFGRAAGSRRCPECGADLGQKYAIVVGHRRPNRAGMAAAGGLVVVCLAVMATPLVTGMLSAPPAGRQTTAKLLNLLSVVDVRTRQDALADLRSRIRDPGNADLIRAHADKLLAYDGPLNPAETGFLHYLFTAELLDAASYEPFLFARYAPTVVTVPSARPEDRIPVLVTLPGRRSELPDVGTIEWMDVRVSPSSAYEPIVELKGVTLEVLDSGLAAVESTLRGALLVPSAQRELPLTLPLPKPETTGERALPVGGAGRVRIALHLEYTVGPRKLTRTHETWHTVEWLDPRAEVLRPVHDPYLHRRVMESLRPMMRVSESTNGPSFVAVRVDVTGPLAEAVAGQAMLVWADQQVPLGPIWLAADTLGSPKQRHFSFRHARLAAGAAPPEHATLVIVPDRTVAGQHVQTRRYLDMELHLPVRTMQDVLMTTRPTVPEVEVP